MTVTNISEKYKGKYVAQVYYGAPQMGVGSAKLGKPAKVLGGWAKTKELAPGRSQTVKISFPIKSMASFDDTGVTGHPSCWVLEAGDYTIYAGDSVASAVKVGTYTRDKFKVVERCHPLPTALDERLLADGSYEKLTPYP
jgi:beta-glucosidase